TSAHRTRSVVLPMPSTSAPRSRSSRAITSTSLMRGTFVSTHSWVVSKHAASSGSAAFLLPSTSTDPDRRRPPSIKRVDIAQIVDLPRPLVELAKIHNLFSQLHAVARSHG